MTIKGDYQFKAISDGLNGVAYKDDCQIIDIRAVKIYANEPCTVVQLADPKPDVFMSGGEKKILSDGTVVYCIKE